MPERRPLTLITGASAGIGAAFARELAQRGHDLVLVARRIEPMQALAAEARDRHGNTVTVMRCDLAQPDAVAELCRQLTGQSLAIDWLINNAGYGVPGALIDSSWETHADFIRVLMTAPTELVWRLLPGMRQRRYGRIVNVASLAGHAPGTAGHTLYAASKAYMIKFSQSLALENAAASVNVSALCPGFTRSEFHDVTGTREKMQSMPDFMWLSADEVARQGVDAVARQGVDAVEHGKVMHITGGVNRLIKTAIDLLPDALALRLSAKGSKRYRNLDET